MGPGVYLSVGTSIYFPPRRSAHFFFRSSSVLTVFISASFFLYLIIFKCFSSISRTETEKTLRQTVSTERTYHNSSFMIKKKQKKEIVLWITRHWTTKVFFFCFSFAIFAFIKCWEIREWHSMNILHWTLTIILLKKEKEKKWNAPDARTLNAPFDYWMHFAFIVTTKK